jgi:LAO/AO transport system kinase
LDRDRRAVARALSLAERGDPAAVELLDDLYASTGRAHIIGVTGAPGTGKSTLVGALAERFRSESRSVGILAVDPSSPFSGGALLGDRIRMARASSDPGVFIRSMASRGELGGLAPTTFLAAQILDAAGFERILIETVGAGQAEVDIVQLAHTTLVVLVPDLGDEVQVFKAGIMEIADVFVINKADRPGVGRLETAVQGLLDLSASVGWRPPIVPVVATRAQGIEPLAEAIAAHRLALQADGAEVRLRRRTELLLHRALHDELERAVIEPARQSGQMERLLDQVLQRRLSPLRAAQELAAQARGAAQRTPR